MVTNESNAAVDRLFYNIGVRYRNDTVNIITLIDVYILLVTMPFCFLDQIDYSNQVRLKS